MICFLCEANRNIMPNRRGQYRRVPLPRAVNVLWMPWVWMFGLFQTVRFGYLIFIGEHASLVQPRVTDSQPMVIWIQVVSGTVGLVVTFTMFIGAIRQLRRRTRLYSERIFYTCIVLLSGSVAFEVIRSRTTLLGISVVEGGRLIVAIAACAASVVILWRKKQWESSRVVAGQAIRPSRDVDVDAERVSADN